MSSSLTLSKSLAIGVALIFSFAVSAPLLGQNRLSDKDVEQLMNNTYQDAKKFQSMFNQSVSKSTIRKTSQEKDAKKLVDTFQKGTKDLKEHFKDTKKSDPYLQNTLDNARQIEKIMHDVQLGPETTTQWAKVRKELDDLADAFNLSTH